MPKGLTPEERAAEEARIRETLRATLPNNLTDHEKYSELFMNHDLYEKIAQINETPAETRKRHESEERSTDELNTQIKWQQTHPNQGTLCSFT